MKISSQQLDNTLEPYGICLRAEEAAAVRTYVDLLLLWNQKISLTSIRDPTEILRRHFGESLFAVRQVPISDGRLADFGSGAGFPALPLKIICPSLAVTLIEPNGRKAAFLSEVKRKLSMTNVEIIRARFQDLRDYGSSMDFITARALGKYDSLLRWAKKWLRPRGKIVLWLGATDAETIREKADWIWQEPILIPGSRERVLLVGRVAPPS